MKKARSVYSVKSIFAMLLVAVMLFTSVCGIVSADGTSALPFVDTDPSEWYADVVSYVYENGLMQGKGEGKFDPDASMTRAEVATLLSRMAEGYVIGLADTAKSFVDIDGTEWHAEYIGWAVEEGLLNGYDDGTMKPDRPILRQEIATILSRFAKFIGLTFPSDTEVPDFKDAGDIDDYAVSSVNELAAAGIIVGFDGRFNPLDPLTRAEAAKLIMMVHVLMSELPVEDTFVPIVRFAVASDTHISSLTDETADRFVKLFDSAYRYAESHSSYNRLDAVVVVGDLTNHGEENELEAFSEIVKSSIKSGTELLAVMGNHDLESGTEMFVQHINPELNFDRVIGGFHFIGISPSSFAGFSQESVEFMKNAIDSAVEEDSEKPIFTFQHHHIKDTVYVSPEWYTTESEELHEIYSEHSQTVNFSGHSHGPINDPTSIWQGDYTALGTGTLYYFELESGMTYGTVPPNSGDAAQYYIVEVDANNTVRILPYNILTDSFFRTPSTADRWDEQLIYYIDKPSDKTTFRYGESREAMAEKPYFESDAELSVTDIGSRKANLTIPQAKDSQAVYYYEIECASAADVRSFDYFSEYYFEPMPKTLTFLIGALSPETEYTITVTPVNCFEIKGESIKTRFTTSEREFSVYSSENPVDFVGTFTDFDSIEKLKKSPLSFAYGGSIKGDVFLGEWRNGYQNTGMKAEIAPNKGYDGSAALEIWSQNTDDLGLYIFATEKNKNTTAFPHLEYLRVWVDFSEVSFEKGAFGLVSATGSLYSTSENTNKTGLSFWYLPEGESEWIEYDHSADGFFGESEDASVKGFKGWLAFPTGDFLYRANTGDKTTTTGMPFSDATIAGVYMNWKYENESYTDSKFYLDEIALVEDFRVFEEYAN